MFFARSSAAGALAQGCRRITRTVVAACRATAPSL